MKKQGTLVIAMLVLFFGGLLLGFFAGRNLTGSPVQLSVLPETTYPATQQQTVPEISEESGTGPVDINTAGLQQLQELPGIGEALALQIMEYRESNGPFTAVSQLLEVPGIGEKKLEQLLPYAKAGGNE